MPQESSQFYIAQKEEFYMHFLMLHDNYIFRYDGSDISHSTFVALIFQDRPWTFAQLVKVQEKLGKEKFPLVQQTYFPGHQEMVNNN